MRVRRVFAVAATVAMSASVLAPASADTVAFKDKRGDLKSGLDVHTVRVDNDGPQISITTKHRNLRKGPKAIGGGVSAFIDIAPRRKGPEFIIAGPVGFDGDYHISKVRRWKMVGKPLRCKSLKFRVNYKRDTVRFAVGRPCLDRAYDQKIGKIRAAVRVVQQRRPGGHNKVDWAPKRRTFYKAVQRN